MKKNKVENLVFAAMLLDRAGIVHFKRTHKEIEHQAG